MSIFVSTFLVLIAAIKNGQTVPTTSTARPERPLFVPSLNYPTMVHPHMAIYGSGRLESAAYYSPYGNNPGYYEFPDVLQRQPSYPPFERVLQNFLHHRGENKKLPEYVDVTDEDDYKSKANNLLSNEHLNSELEDLDRKYKRSTTYVNWNSPTTKTSRPSANLENKASTFNSRAVNVLPFGPYTTWSPYEGPLVTSYAGPKNTNSGLRRRRNNNIDDDDDREKDLNSYYPTQYAPAFNTYLTLPVQAEAYRMRYIRDMPLQHSVVYEPTYPVDRNAYDNPALLTNSLLVNLAPPANADEPEKLEKFTEWLTV